MSLLLIDGHPSPRFVLYSVAEIILPDVWYWAFPRTGNASVDSVFVLHVGSKVTLQLRARVTMSTSCPPGMLSNKWEYLFGFEKKSTALKCRCWDDIVHSVFIFVLLTALNERQTHLAMQQTVISQLPATVMSVPVPLMPKLLSILWCS